MNYDNQVLGVENNNHPANQIDEPAKSIQEQLIDDYFELKLKHLQLKNDMKTLVSLYVMRRTFGKNTTDEEITEHKIMSKYE